MPLHLFFLVVCSIYVMCLTPRNHFEFVDKLQRVESYTTYNAEIDVCDYLDVDRKISICDTGWERLIRSHSSARFCFKLSGNSN